VYLSGPDPKLVTADYSAWFYDGKTAVKRNVTVGIVGQTFWLDEDERRHGPYNFDDLHYSGEQAGADIYGMADRDGWRLGLSGDVPEELAAMLPAKKVYGGFIDRLGLGPAAAAFTAISIAIIAIALFTPQWLAPLVPSNYEKRLGDALVGDFGGRFCHTPKGDAALKKLTQQIDKGSSGLRVEVANIDMLNAVALPGGNVILFNGLVSKANSPDEVAGVLAHEIGHVRKRHVMQSLLRQLGLSVILGGIDGNAGSMVNGVLATTYTRSAESEADAYSMKALSHANISPAATAKFFDRLAKLDGSADSKANGKGGMTAVTDYLSSHPLSTERKKAFENSVIKGQHYQPALSPSEWGDLKSMCAQDKKVKSGFGFGFGDDT
jgi:beta-barrel assembly-enhancing protease